MVPITKDNITNEQIAKLVYYFALYKEIMTKNPESMLSKLNFMQRQALKKHISGVKEFYEQLDEI